MTYCYCQLLKHHFSRRKLPHIYCKDTSSLFLGTSDNLCTLSISASKQNHNLFKAKKNNDDFLYCRSASVPGSSNAAAGSNRRLQQTQHQVDEVVDIMRVNVDKVLERDQKLSELDDRADALQAGASQFETSAAKLKRKYWWKNCKMWAILIAVVVIIIIIIIVLSVPS
uniref:Vesicle associated membrane protein 3 n=1 Tax=Calidris pygmaea TaxID=425635 RepID=A0A8C3K0M2_9CHAR